MQMPLLLLKPQLTFNRTIVELKCMVLPFFLATSTSFNRTIVELKLAVGLSPALELTLLTEP